MAHDFKRVAAAALDMAAILLPQWIGGKRVGHEWHGERKTNGGVGDAWKINLNTGIWANFGGTETGGDLVDLYAALNHLDLGAAVVQVAQQTGSNETTAPILARTKPPEKPAEPIPEDAPALLPHYKYGAASAVYRYGTAFWIARYDYLDEEGKLAKTLRPFTWRGGEWAAKAYPDPKPLYGRERLPQRPAAPVLIVEGEKCADAARKILTAYVVLTWAGGAQAVKKNDWSVLKDRDVIIWPDADGPGATAAAHIAEILFPIGKRVRVITPTDQAPGWDVADAIASGWNAKAITTWATKHVRVVTLPDPTPAAAGGRAARDSETAKPRESLAPATAAPGSATLGALAPATDIPRSASLSPDVSAPGLATYLPYDDDSAPVAWETLGLDTNQGGIPHATVSNASMIVQMHPRLRGKIWYDTFTQKIYTTLKGVAREWRDEDDIDLTVFMQQSMRLPKFNIMMVQSAVGHAARRFARNSLTDWLGSIKWDGVSRLDTWLTDCLGVEQNEYTQAVARNWAIALVARAYVPGCKMDHMPVLEGTQGLSKTSFLEILGGPWYGSIPLAFGDKDFLQAIQGKWIVEIPDMTGFGKREHSQILATITIRQDIYRQSYGRRTNEYPRTAVFAATSEHDDYLQDTRGRRRYWPLRCIAIDLDILRAQRDQIFAEAVLQYRAGAKWYVMPGQADDEQTARSMPDLWTDAVLHYANGAWEQARLLPYLRAITSSQILSEALDVKLKDQGDIEKRRINRIMRENGWIQVRDPDRRWKKIER